jgi:hypothetical protein
LVSPHERNEARLAEAAAGTLTMIRSALAAGADATNAVVSALSANFMSIGALSGELDCTPGVDGTGDVVAAILNDRGALGRLIPELVDIVGLS